MGVPLKDRKAKLVLLALLTLFFVNGKDARAIEPLLFHESPTPYAHVKISKFLHDIFQTEVSDYKVAEIDLNGDGNKEFILKRKYCAGTNTTCIHLVLAQKKDEIVMLSNIPAKNLMIAGTKTFGIKDILAFKNEINQYDFDIYIWSPGEKKYIVKRS